MRPFQLLSSALLCTSVASASWIDGKIGAAFDVLVPHKRSPQAVTLGDDNAASPNPTQSINTDQKSSSASATQSNSDQSSQTGDSSSSGSASGTASNTRSGTGTGTASKTGTGTASNTGTASRSGSTTKATTFAPDVPAGGIAMVTPNTRLSTEYFKIGDHVTFGWNYTSVKVTPTAVDILATCTKANAMFTLALNHTVTNGSVDNFVWDTDGYQATATPQLLTETYTLIIHDSNKDTTAFPSPGYLSTYNQFTFGMYSPQPYTPFDQFVCVTCSGALSSLERQSMLVMGIMATGAVLGATWFTGGFALW